MSILHIYWDDHPGKWPACGTKRRWLSNEIDELKAQLNRVAMDQVANAIGSLQLDLIDKELKLKAMIEKGK